MERLTVPAERLPDGGTRLKIIDARKVKEHAMEFYWRLKKYEDTGFTPEGFDKLCREMSDLRMMVGLNTYEDLREAIQSGKVKVTLCQPENQTSIADCEDKQHSGLLEE